MRVDNVVHCKEAQKRGITAFTIIVGSLSDCFLAGGFLYVFDGREMMTPKLSGYEQLTIDVTAIQPTDISDLENERSHRNFLLVPSHRLSGSDM